MSMDSVCQENIDSLKSQLETKEKEFNFMNETTNVNMWLSELEELEKSL